MVRKIISIITGFVVSFLLLYSFTLFSAKTGLTPFGRVIQMSAKYESFEEMDMDDTETFFKELDKSLYFDLLVIIPSICILTSLVTSLIGRKKIWLSGLISVIPITLLSMIPLFTIPYLDYLLIFVSLLFIYLGLGALVGFGVQSLKQKKSGLKFKN